MSYDQAKVVEKLRSLNSSQQSIETVSMYCQVLKRHAANVVADWSAEFSKQPPPRKLALLYLANDVLQNSRKKGAEYVAEFHRALPKALKAAASSGDPKLTRGAQRLVGIWEQRRVFGSHTITSLKEAVGNGSASTPRAGASSSAAASKGDGGTASAYAAPPLLQTLADALQKTDKATAARTEAGAACAVIPDVMDGESHAQLQQYVVTLQKAHKAAVAEGVARARVVKTLQAFMDVQHATEAALEHEVNTWENKQQRAEALLGAQQSGAPIAEGNNSHAADAAALVAQLVAREGGAALLSAALESLPQQPPQEREQHQHQEDMITKGHTAMPTHAADAVVNPLVNPMVNPVNGGSSLDMPDPLEALVHRMAAEDAGGHGGGGHGGLEVDDDEYDPSDALVM